MTAALRILARFAGLLLAASVLIFLLLRAVPGDPARIALGVTATDEAVAALSAKLGTDRPLFTQYIDWVAGLCTGRFGVSMSSGTDITALVLERAGVSLALTLSAMALALVIAVPVGIFLARRDRTPAGTAVAALTQLGIVVPSFLVAILAVGVFSVRLGWLPANGWGGVSNAVLPVAALAVVQAAILTRYVRSTIEEEMEKDYVRTARARGASIREVLFTRALKNAALPLLTVAGVQLSSLVVGAVVIERVFAIPGLGSMLIDAVGNRDLTTVQTLLMLLVAFTLLVNLVVDLLYAVVDPRVRRGH
ncbi:Glutathione transport system permease protein GsiC [Corynebacterium capitovis DSM 44611]|uniref:ABC transporter permease n=1 Tax=Corynebacterium capitovis TaxID=131081 RepID=UPI00036DDD3A|nr:ABC transporter permease [Corynebacterium capitovis]WKD57227.1 Glutathione transport system permease protein GsiC [Corynebacterium capitovis DSM 44611]